MLESLFNKVRGLQAYNFTKKRLKHRGFPVNIANFKNTYFKKHLQTAASDSSIYCVENWIKLFRNQNGLLFLLKHKSTILLSLVRTHSFQHSLSCAVMHYHFLLLVVIRCQSLSLAVPHFVTGSTTRCHSLYTHCHSLSLIVVCFTNHSH